MKKVIAVRKESENVYLVYNYEQRSTTKVNELGAIVMDLFLNKDKSVDEIAAKISNKFDVNYDTAVKDVRNFLGDIYKRLTIANINESEQNMLDRPIGAEIEITTACNLRCKHCFQGEYPEKYMSLEVFKNIVDILKTNDVYEVNMVGGEIFKHKDVMEMLKYLDDNGMAVTIVTNAVGITDVVMGKLKAMKNLYVLVSVDGTKELHDQIRGEGQFDKIIPKIRKMNEEGMEVEILCTINAINVKHVKEIAKMGNELGVPVNFNLFKPFAKKHDYLIVNPDDFFEAVENLLKMRVHEGYKIGISDASLSAYMMGLPEKNECTATMSGIVINTDGKMLTCPYLLEAGYYTKNDLPDFNQDFLEEWKHGKMFTEFRQHGQKACQARAFIYSKDVGAGDPYDLDSYKEYRAKKMA